VSEFITDMIVDSTLPPTQYLNFKHVKQIEGELWILCHSLNEEGMAASEAVWRKYFGDKSLRVDLVSHKPRRYSKLRIIGENFTVLMIILASGMAMYQLMKWCIGLIS
jgi:hypothetical protein